VVTAAIGLIRGDLVGLGVNPTMGAAGLAGKIPSSRR
jgi:hypothetical protein